jgi:pimeloyl-ACP methyl ester carboxylesterase
MKQLYKAPIRVCLYVTMIFFLIIACDKDDKDPLSGEYLVSYSPLFNYSSNSIEALLTFQMLVYPELAPMLENIHYGVQVYSIQYKTHYGDSLITASGLVCLPISAGSYPVISFQNGTNTLHTNAPSVNPMNQGYLIMELVASNGFVVLIPDYIGFGSSSEILHPYYDRKSTNNAILDLIRAFRELSGSGQIIATGNDSLFLLGYSQGGGATASVLDEIENEQSLDMNVIAASCGAGAYDLMDFSAYVLEIESFPGPLYFPYYIYAHQAIGNITAPLSAFFQEPYAGNIPGLFDGLHSNDEINGALTETIADLLTPEMLDNFATASTFAQLRESLEENSVHGWNASARINLYHGTEDDNVPPQQSLAIYNEFIEAGTNSDLINLYEMDGLDHGTGLFPWGIQTINWFNTLRQNLD